MNRIFLATSPLHILVSIMVASPLREDKNILILTGKNHSRNKIFSDAFTRWKDSPFTKVYLLNKSRRPDDFSIITQRINIDEIVVGNDLIPEFYALIANRHISSNTILSYMDDGLHSYIEYKKAYPKKIFHFLSNIFRRVSKGYTKPFPHTLGSSPLTKNCYLFHPESGKKSLKSKHCQKIENNEKQLSDVKDFALCILNSSKILDTISGTDYTLLALPHNKNINEELICDISEHLSTRKGEILIKNHPSNTNDSLKNIPNIGSYTEVPKEIPMELLLAIRPPKTIIGGLSSIFISAELFRSDITFKILGDKKNESLILGILGK